MRNPRQHDVSEANHGRDYHGSNREPLQSFAPSHVVLHLISHLVIGTQ